MAGEGGGVAGSVCVAAATTSTPETGAPQALQKEAPAGSSTPQAAHAGLSSAPHPAQKRASSSLARPQDGQFLAMIPSAGE